LENKKLPSGFLHNPINFLAFGFGSGCAPKAPGTFGTLAAVPLYLIMNSLALEIYIGVCLFAFILGVWFCSHASKALGVHDHGGIVWDEFVGYWIAMIAAPEGWLWVFVGFVLFRLFDIWKPWPIRLLDKRVSGGFGIMIDDVVAGIYALVGMQIAAFTASLI
jgi:phosphatidylglycerophosphatase A